MNISKLTKEIEQTFEKKQADYGNSFEKTLDEYGDIAAMVRIADKYNRLCSIFGKSANFESERDTLLDLATYCIMYATYLEKHQV